ncbi:MAG: choice-of-anchor J domain-containing protein [Bacteroidales bacterium]|nr:choice-of-anchor J domain-containing protein [Bacteroidales bacterium]
MKKLYLVATLVWAAFMGNVGTEASANGLRKTLPVSTEAHPALRGNAGTIHVWEVEKKKEAAISQSSPLEAISQLASHTKADSLMKLSPWEGHVLQTNRPRSGKLYGLSVENGVILNPEEGETKIYKRSGGAYIVMQNQVMAVSQSSAEYLETVETADGTVYFKNILATLITDSWVKGTKVGNQIILPANQNLYYSDQRDLHLQLSWGARNGIAFSYTEEHPENFTFVIDGDSIALQGTDAEGAFMGAFWENDKSFFGYGDYETVLKPVDAEKKSHELVQLPDGVEAQPWILTTKSYTSDNKESYDTRRIKVAINGLNVYVRGLFLNYPNAWIKGMRIGTTVNFESYQYLGIKDGYEAWAIGLDVQGADDIRITDFSFQYNEEEGTLLCNTPVASNQSEFKLSIKDLYFGAYIEKFTPVEFTAPFLDSINTLDKFLNYETVDANKDGKTWNFDANNKVAVCFYSMDLIASDDWLITPAINLTANQLYTFRVDAAARTEKYPEKFVVKFGKVPTPEGLTQTLIDTTTTTNPAFDTYTSEEFKVEESGQYYVGIQCISEPNMWRLAVSSLGVSLAVPGPVPAEIAEATIHADAEGELKADVTFTAPDKDKKGETLEGDVHVILQVDEVTIDTVTMAPGATFTYPLTVDKPKSYVVTLIPYVVEGKEGKKTRRSAWIGEDIPVAVEDFKGRNIGSKVYFTWTAADKGVNGGVVKSETVTYNIYTAIGYSTTNGNIYIADSLLNKEPLTGTEYLLEDDLFAESDQSTHAYIIVAQNGAGKSEESTGYALVGKPYELPFLEDFDGVGLRYYWSAYGKIDIDADDDDNYSVTLMGSEGTVSYLSSGMICLKGAENPSLILDVASIEGTPLKIYIDAASGSFQQIGSFETTEEYVKQKISLKDYVDEEWIVFVLAGSFDGYDDIVIDNIAIKTLLDNNLAVYLSAPESVTMGVNADLKVSVENLGENSVSNYAIKVYADDQLTNEIVASDVEEVAFGQTAEYVVGYTASLFSAGSEVVLRAEVVFSADEDDTDNTDETEVKLLTPVADPVMTVAANVSDAGLTISWKTTPAEEVDVLEDFESYEDQIVTDGQYLGRWLGYDVDQLKTYDINFDDQEIEWPFDDALYAFCIWTPSLYTQDADNLAFSANGNKSLLFMGAMPDDEVEANDDWLISPELTGKAQTISFEVSELDASYGEELYEVYYSTTDKEISSFILLAEGVVEDTEFSERSYDLPEGAKYFAIRYVSEDIYSFIVDNIQYKGLSVETPTGFNIYVNEELVATVEADATSFDYEAGLSEGTTYEVSVTALYGSRESLPVSAEVAVSAIEEVAAPARAAEVYNLSGIRVRTDKALKSGVYVIDGQKSVVK